VRHQDRQTGVGEDVLRHPSVKALSGSGFEIRYLTNTTTQPREVVAALEYAGGIKAEIVGKPSPTFFNLALDDLGLTANDVVMFGDDLEAGIGGAKAAGMQTIQVKF
jgi:HAD superfamily hydrolase (TIGR01509 family)